MYNVVLIFIFQLGYDTTVSGQLAYLQTRLHQLAYTYGELAYVGECDHHRSAATCHSTSSSSYREARLVEVQMWLVADHKLTRIQRKKYRVLQAKLHDQW